MNSKILTGLALAALALTGCASMPDRIEELEQARTAVQAIDREPMAERVAGAEVKQAKEALARAEPSTGRRMRS